MKLLKITVFCLFSIALAFGQQAKKMDHDSVARAWNTAMSLPSDTPPVSGGGLTANFETDGVECNVWLVATLPGTYLLRGNKCNGGKMDLGDLQWETAPSPSFSGPVFKSGAQSIATPQASVLCSVDLLRIDRGRIEQSSVNINLWNQTDPKPQFGSEGTKEGRYYVATGILPTDATVLVGRVVAEIQRSPMGSICILPAGTNLPPAGPTSLTVCSKGKCSTTTFERRIEVQSPTSGEKGE
jgi:hypothetical protein